MRRPAAWVYDPSDNYYKRRPLAGGAVMAVDFRGHPVCATTGCNAPTRFEADVFDCEVSGKMPSDIDGNFHRMQCDFQYRPPQNEWPTGFNGDGHISRFMDTTIAPGAVLHPAVEPIDRHWVA